MRSSEERDFDFVVADSTPSGLIAAIAAARQGLKVVIVTEDQHLGGVQTSGLGWTNAGQRETVGGLTREFHQRVHEFYTDKYGADSEQVIASDKGLHFEPHVAEKIYTDWLAEAGVHCVINDPVVLVEKSEGRLEAVITQAGKRLRGRVFLDASYEGDLMHLAGCSWYAGRESREVYKESLAGARLPSASLSRGDRKLQAYDYRLCLTNDSNNRVPFHQPKGYDPRFYEWHAARMQSSAPQSLYELLPLNPMPNHKTDSRTGEMVGASWDWPHVSLKDRQRIASIHRCYSAGYIWFLLTDPRVPNQLQEELHQWGFAADEFVDNGNWPYHIYVREARRLVGEYVMSQRDVTSERFKPDAIALGSFYLDVHAVDLIADTNAPAGLRAEGVLGELGVRPYEIPYRSLLPLQDECENLLVTTCLSASHVAYSTIRMEPVFMCLGHAAGVAGAIAIKDNRLLIDVPILALQSTLKQQGQKLDASPFHEVYPCTFTPAPDVR